MIKWARVYKGNVYICLHDKRIYRMSFEGPISPPSVDMVMHYDVPMEVLNAHHEKS